MVRSLVTDPFESFDPSNKLRGIDFVGTAVAVTYKRWVRWKVAVFSSVEMVAVVAFIIIIDVSANGSFFGKPPTSYVIMLST